MSQLLITRDGRVLRLLLNRPEKRNALTGALILALVDALRAADADPEVRVVLLSGAGGVFCAGADLGEMQSGWRGDAYATLLETLFALQTPLVVKVERFALAGAVGIVALAHFALAEEGARFATPELQRGIFPMMVLAPLTRTVPRRVALEMVLTGRTLLAPEAAAVGLISAAHPAAELDRAAEDLLQRLAALPSAATALGLGALAAQDRLRMAEALPQLQAALDLARATPDAREGIAAFLERRLPRF
ncbi:MAG: enoyl-CoA hydratase/isomerase family protein [Deltaproteobacteria bacterium]|nr:enoyl-CoA hydratase/isomerase family protein [Deltaproteobacteria bacterium]